MPEVKEEKYFRKELHYGSFTRSLAIFVPVKVDEADAVYENGVLTLTMPKSEAVQPKAIKVNAGKGRELKSGEQKK